MKPDLGESTRERLRRVPLFAALSDEALDRLAGLSRIVHVGRKEVVFSEGRPYRGMFVVLSGLVVVYKLSKDGRMLILHVCRPGDVVAETPMFEDSDAGYPAHAKATREGELLFLPRDGFAPFVRTHPEVAWELLRRLAARLKETGLQLEGVTLREVSSRLARYLVREVEAAGHDPDADGTPELVLPLTKGSIASYLGTVHETLSRTFARLIRERVLEVEGPRIKILDLERLRRML
jgi:CRP/FNR family transcriptional regulator